ncbi:MAG: peptidoglycan synthetase [Bacteroidia bacterium]
MHNLAIALSRKGYVVTGSDDAIYDPARRNLEAEGLLPEVGWNPENIHIGLDQVILGMHARPDNPELIKATEMGLEVMSFPEFVAKESENKTRLVVAGSHGKTTTTSMLMHALKQAGFDFDYLVGSSIEGFDLSVKLTDAPLILIEGDEYLSSPIDRRSKFHWYNPDISIITGIAYDHINVFPSFQSYLDTFDEYIKAHRPESHIIWFQGDEHLESLIGSAVCNTIAYHTPEYSLQNHQSSIHYNGELYPLSVIGEHNLQNIEAASLATELLNVDKADFFRHMSSFEGAGKRMEKWLDSVNQVIYRDFAHSPSKLQATTKAVKDTYKDRTLLAVFELHTFSSLNRSFLPYYKDSMKSADRAIVYIDPHVFEHRKMEVLSKDEIKDSFGEVEVLDNPQELVSIIEESYNNEDNILLMSSGTFSESEFSFRKNK